jgi:TRAP-type C4-dicarboxylate transport system permease small subunit
MSSAASQAKSTASRAADSKPLEYLARGGFIAYGVIHLLFAWLALQIAFGNSGKESDQSGALTELASKPFGEVLVIIVIIGMVALAVWQGFLAALGEKDEQGKAKVTDRVVSGIRAIIYLTLAWSGFKIVQGAGSSNANSQEKGASTLLDHTGGRWLLGLIGLVVVGVGVGLAIYGLKKKFEDHQNTQQMRPSVRRTIQRLGMAGYTAKGVAYVIAGVLVVTAAVTYDPDKARGLDAALRTLAQASYGPWLLGLIALGIAAFGVFCFAQAKYRKV